MTDFTVVPYSGPLPLCFGMSPDEVRAILAGQIAVMAYLSIGYSNDGMLEEVVFSRGARLVFLEKDLFEVPDPIGFLQGFDAPFEWVGFVLFPKLGIRLSGFHDNDKSQEAIGVVRRGYWDEYVHDFLPFQWPSK